MGSCQLAGMALHTVPSWGQGCQTFTAYTFPSPDGGLRGSSETLGEALLGPKGSLSSMGLAAEGSPGALLAASGPEAVCVAHCGTCHIIRTCPRSQGGDRGFLVAATALPSLSLSPVAPRPPAKKPSWIPQVHRTPSEDPCPWFCLQLSSES